MKWLTPSGHDVDIHFCGEDNMSITLVKAEAVVNTIPSREIQIKGEFPRDIHGDDLQRFFANEAMVLSRCLIDSLPGGTLDALLVVLLENKRSSLIVRHKDVGKRSTT